MLGSEIVERAFSEWLYPAGVSRPGYDVLSGSLNNTAVTFTVEGRLAIPRDAMLEIEREVLQVKSVSGSSVTVQARGYLNTDAASHANGVPVYVNPRFFQVTLLNHLQTIVGKLYNWGLYRRVVNNSLVFPSGEAPLALPAGAKRVRSIRFKTSTGAYSRRLRLGKDFEELTDLDPLEVQFISGGNPTLSLSIVYAADWQRPALEDDLDIPVGVQDGLPMAVAGYALQGIETNRLNVTDIKKLLAAQGAGVPVGSHLNIGRTLVQAFMQMHVDPEKQRLEEQDPHGVEFVT